MADALYPLTVPKWGIEMQEGTISGWHVEEGASVTKGDELIDIETDKIVNTLEAPMDGVVRKRLVEEGETLKVGELLGVLATGDADDSAVETFVKDFVPVDASFGIDEDVAEAPAPAAPEPVAAARAPVPESSGSIRVSPVARRIAKELGVDLATVQGTGRNGRISKEDVEAAAANLGGAAAPDVQKLSARRQTIAKRLVASKQNVPHYYLSRDIDFDHVMQAKAASDGVSVSAIIIAAVARALVKHPSVNSHMLDEGLAQQATVDINIAVDTPDGLIAPLLRDLATTSPRELSSAIATAAEKSRNNQLTADDLALGGFTVSNLGGFGIDTFTAIINPPQVAILAVGKARQVPVMRDGQWAESNVCSFTLSCDHRVIDGADGARFLQTLAEELQNIEV